MSIIAMLLLSMVLTLPITSVAATPTTYVSVINASKYFRAPPINNPDTGYNTTWFNYTDTQQPPNPTNYPLGQLTVNITITDVQNLMGWQVNLTWDPTLLSLKAADLYFPSDHILHDLDPVTLVPKDVNNVIGFFVWACAVGPSSPYPSFNGSGTLCVAKFNVTQEPSSSLSCTLHLDTAGIMKTKLSATPPPSPPPAIPFTPQDGYYQYSVPPPPPPPTEGASLNVQPPEIINSSILPPQTIQVNITVKNVTDMYDYQFSLSFDPSILTCISLTVLDALGETNYIPRFLINNITGLIEVNVTYYSPAVPITTVPEVALVELVFRVKARGVSVFDLHDTNLTDPLRRQIPHEVHDGLFVNLIRDLAATNVVSNRNWAYQGQLVLINVTVRNEGEIVEASISVKAYYDSNLIGTMTIASLNPSQETTITFEWYTLFATPGNYTISAEVVSVLYELDLADNTFTDGNVEIVPLPPPPPIGGASLDVQPPEIIDPSILPPQTIQVNITVKNVTDMYGYEFSLNFNPSILTCISLTVLDALGETNYIPEISINNIAGLIKVNVTYYSPAVPITTVPEVALVKLVFRVKGKGVSILDLHDTNLIDFLGRPIPHVAHDGLFVNLIRDLAVTNVVPDRNWAYQGQLVLINVTVRNEGEIVETSISVKAYYDSNLIGTMTIASLNPSEETTIAFDWDTSSAVPCINYTISAEVVSVLYELDLADNTFTDGNVKIEAPPPPTEGASLNVQPPEIIDPSILPPQTIQINITVKNVTNMYDYQFSLDFNPSILTCISLTVLDALGETNYISQFSIDNIAGLIKVNVTYYPPAVPITTVPEVALVNLVFRVKARGVSVFDLHDTNLSDPLGRSIPHDVHDGLFKSLIRDLAVTNVVPTKNWAYQGRLVLINVTVRNEGEIVETSISVKAYYDSNLIGTISIASLNPSEEKTITFNWGTSFITPCHNYTISAEVLPVPYELELGDNTFTDGNVKIRIIGDITGEGVVDIDDVLTLIAAFGSYPSHPSWNEYADISGEGVVDIVDLIWTIAHWGNHC